MAIDILKRTQCRNILILEKGSQVGGTWNDNKYPGCACDGKSLQCLCHRLVLIILSVERIV
jgi:cation diffusion facilitator CzcD-associated flavoprotein CzcO